MLISEIFHSLQGEGSLTGVASAFVRTSGCNLRCSWCDTPYASWSPEGAEMDIDVILAQIDKKPCSHVVLTGGEPMVAKGIHELATAIRATGRHITIETAATIAPRGIACDLASLSPKLANSTPTPEQAGPGWHSRHEQRRLQPDVIRAWIENADDYQLKFVAASPADLDEIDSLLQAIEIPIPPHKVLLMPEGTSVEALDARLPFVAEACATRGFRLCDRLHIRLFGNTRGT